MKSVGKKVGLMLIVSGLMIGTISVGFGFATDSSERVLYSIGGTILGLCLELIGWYFYLRDEQLQTR